MSAIQRIADVVVRMVPGFGLAAILFPALYPLRRKRLTAKHLSSRPAREVLLALLWMFCGGMAVLTLTPPGFHWLAALRCGYSLPAFSVGSVNLIPFQTFGQSGLILLGNIVMFVPFGLLAAFLWRGFSWKRALLLGVCITAFIECAQLFVGRAFDIDDLLLNTFGVLCGCWLWRLVNRFKPSLSQYFWVTSH